MRNGFIVSCSRDHPIQHRALRENAWNKFHSSFLKQKRRLVVLYMDTRRMRQRKRSMPFSKWLIMKSLLPEPPEGLAFEDVNLFYVGVMPGDERRGLVPYYHHRILVESADVGHINFKVGDTDHVRLYAGHVGFEVKPVYRGHGYAEKACRALIPLMTQHYEDVILTADPTNLASLRTIERLGASFENELPVPETDPQFLRGARTKRRYRWSPMGRSAREIRDGVPMCETSAETRTTGISPAI